jgi:hypothetical protein
MKDIEKQQRISTILFVIVTAIFFLLMCTGCSTTVPVTAKFPEAPARLLERCPEKLQEITGDKTNIIDFTKTVAINYGTYHECAVKNDAWIEWYNTQKKIFNEVK